MIEDIELLIVRNLSGEASSNDIFLLSEWLCSDKKNKECFLRIKKYWDANVSGIQMSSRENSFEHLTQLIKKSKNKPVTSQRWFKSLNIAVAALLTGTIIYLGFFKPTPAIEHYNYITGNSTSELSLPDGTSISLNKNSTLVYTSEYGNKKREVSLQGEAYFNVAKNKEQQFILDLNGTKITVLGTIFNVKNNLDETSVVATLLEGSIRFETPDQSVLLKPDQQLSYNKTEKKIDISSAKPELITVWKDNLIRYKSITFAEFVTMLNEYYKVNITVTGSRLSEQRISGTFDANLSVEQILNIMKNNLLYKWTRQGNTYLIE